MKTVMGSVVLVAVFCTSGLARQATEVNPVLEKIKSLSWKAKGTIAFQGNERPMTTAVTVQGLSFVKQEFESEFSGDKIKGVSVLAGDKGWRIFRDIKMPLENVDDERRTLSLTVIPILLVQLKGKEFKLETLPEEKLGGKIVLGLKVTPPKGKDFKIYFDKESGLPVRLVAKVGDFGGGDFTQETTFSGYKMLSGINKATKITSKRDGGLALTQEITEFMASEKEADPKMFVVFEGVKQ